MPPAPITSFSHLNDLTLLVESLLEVIKTKPTWGSKLRRLEGKKQRGDIKAMRGKPIND